MKSKFYVPIQLLTLEEQLKKQEPFASVVISTTGLDSKDFDEHCPIRVCIKEYQFNKQVGEYEEAETKFDKLISANREALEKAVEEADKDGGYDTFRYCGIDRDAYIKGENVLEPEDFKREFETYCEYLKKNNALLIVNGGYSFAEKYLGKIECGTVLDSLKDNDKVCDLTSLSKQYFEENKINFKGGAPTLEEINAVISKKDPATAQRIEGADRRAQVVDNFIVKLGIDKGILQNDWETFFKRRDIDIIADMSRKGRKEYENKDYETKLEVLMNGFDRKKNKIIDADKIVDRDSDCDISTLFRTLADKDKKGVIVMQAATTGLDFGEDLPYRVGEPIQFTALVYNFNEDGSINTQQPVDNISMDIKASDAAIGKAKALADGGKFDAFEYTGIKYADYMKAIENGKIHSSIKAGERVIEFFEKYKPEDYVIVSNGRQEDGKLFTQHAISIIGNSSIVTAPCVDFTQAIKEYCGLCHKDYETYKDNRLVDPNTYDGKDFSLEEIARHNGMNNIKSTQLRCLFTAQAVSLLLDQQIELFPEQYIREGAVQEKEPEGRTKEEFEDKLPEEEPEEEPNEVQPEEEPASEPTNEPANEPEPERDGEDGGEKDLSAITRRVRKMEIPSAQLDVPSPIEETPEPKEEEPKFSARAARTEEQFRRRGREYRHIPERRMEGEPKSDRPFPERTEMPKPAPSVDVEALIKAVTEAGEMNRQLAEQNKSLTEILVRQNAVMENVANRLLDIANDQNKVFGYIVGYDKSDPKSITSYLDGIKEKITKVSEDLNNEKAATALADANNSILKSQKQIDKDIDKENDDKKK